MRYLVTSDIHLGHRKTPTKHIIASFVDTILTEANKDIQVLFIAGDLFDHLLYLNTPEAQQIVQFFHKLLDYCHQHQIALRVLEGTPLHDQFQSQILTKINDIRDRKVDLKYHKVLEIDYIPSIQKHVLYIPDQWVNSQEDLERQVNQQLAARNLTQVDIAILHGAFKYQTKGIPTSEFTYDESYFHHLVKGYIHIGHYHVHNPLDRIIPNGSLERLAHGEEEDKGYVTVTDDTWQFHINPFSFIYKTIQITAKTTLESLDKQISKYPAESQIRLQMKKDHPFNTIFQELRARYPNHHIKRLVKDSSSDTSSVAYILTDDTPLQLSENLILDTNVKAALETVIMNKHSFTPSEQVKLEQYLQIFESSKSTETLLA